MSSGLICGATLTSSLIRFSSKIPLRMRLDFPNPVIDARGRDQRQLLAWRRRHSGPAPHAAWYGADPADRPAVSPRLRPPIRGGRTAAARPRSGHRQETASSQTTPGSRVMMARTWMARALFTSRTNSST